MISCHGLRFLLPLCLCASLHAAVWQEGFEPGSPAWSFSPGGEFKGAKGEMETTSLQFRSGARALRLAADFSGGGKYVMASRNFAEPLDAVGASLWIKPANVAYLLVRTLDGSGQTFQHQCRIEPNDNWQRVELASLRSRVRWGGANNGQWNGGLKGLAVLLERPAILDNGTMAEILVDDIAVTLADDAALTVPLRLPVPLGTFEDGLFGWWPLMGNTDSATLAVDPSTGHGAPGALRADLAFKGRRDGWATLIRQLDQPFDIAAIDFAIKTDNLSSFTLAILTTSGQNFHRRIAIDNPGEWARIAFEDIAPGTEPIKPNDDRLYGAPVAIRITGDAKYLIDPARRSASIWLDDVSATALGKGVLYTPGAALRAENGLVGRLDLPGSLPIFFGPQAKPTRAAARFINAGGEPVTTPPVRLLDHALRPVATLHRGGDALAPGATAEIPLALALPRYGHYTLETVIAGKPLRARLAWLAEEGKPDPESPFGIHHHLSQGPWGRSQYLGGGAAAIALTRKLGIGWMREDIRGTFDKKDALQSSPRHGFYGWADVAKAEGISVIGTYFDFFHDNRAPDTDESRARFARRFVQLVKHFGDAVRVFEVWNEPNIQPGWRAKPRAAEYAALIQAVYPAIKAADPKATVVGITSCGTDFRYIDQVFAAGAGPFMDAFSAHPYHGVAPERANPSTDARPEWMGGGDDMDFLARIDTLASIAKQHGRPGLPIWATEMGNGNKDDATEWWDACRVIRQLLLGTERPQLTRQFLYNFQDQGYNEEPASHMTFGLVRADGSPEPRLVAFSTLNRALHRKPFAKRVDLGADIHALQFAGQPGTTLALWTVDTGATASFRTRAPRVQVLDLMGNVETVTPVDGRVSLAASGTPLFVLDAGEVAPAAPLLALDAPPRGTSEDAFVVRVVRDASMKTLPLAGEAGPGPGWRVVGASGDAVTFRADPDIENGHYVLAVRAGGMGAAATVEIRNALVVNIRTLPDEALAIAVENPFPSSRSIALHPATRDQDVKLDTVTLQAAPATTTTIRLPVPTRTPEGWTTRRVSLNPKLAADVSGYIQLPKHGDTAVAGFTPWHAMTAVIDGAFGEWDALPPCRLDQAEQAVGIGRFAKPAWKGEDDLAAAFRIGSDASAIHFEASLRDDVRVQPFGEAEMWKGDSMQFAFLHGGVRYECTLAVDDAGDVRVRQDSPQRRVLAAATGRARIDGVNVRFEASIPWAALGIAEPPHHPDSFALLVNDNDKANASEQGGRKGYLEWFGGIGGFDGKNPSRYGPVKPMRP